MPLILLAAMLVCYNLLLSKRFRFLDKGTFLKDVPDVLGFTNFFSMLISEGERLMLSIFLFDILLLLLLLRLLLSYCFLPMWLVYGFLHYIIYWT
jgi:hypothetical protein